MKKYSIQIGLWFVFIIPVMGLIYFTSCNNSLKAEIKQPRVLTGLFSQIADKTISNTTTETSMLNLVYPTNIFIPDYFYEGKNEKYELWGICSRQNGNVTINVKLNNVLIMTTGSFLVGSMNNDVYKLEWCQTIRNTGVFGTIRGQGRFMNLNNGNNQELVMLQDIVINTTIPQTLDVTWQWSNANAGNTVTNTNTTKYILN